MIFFCWQFKHHDQNFLIIKMYIAILILVMIFLNNLKDTLRNYYFCLSERTPSTFYYSQI